MSRFNKMSEIVLACVLAASLTACGTAADTTEAADTTAAETTEKTEETDAAETVNTAVLTDADGNESTAPAGTFTGTVTEVSDNTITLSVMMSDGEYVDFTSMGGGMGGQMPSGGMVGQAPSGNTDGSAPEMPSGDTDGSVPEKPSGEQENSDGSAPEMPSGGMDGQAPSGNTDGSAPEMPSGDQSGSEGSAQEMPSGDFTADMETATVTLTINDTTLTDGLEIQEGTMLSVTIGDNGEVTALSVSEGMGGEMGGQGGQPGGNDSSAAAISYTAVTEYDSNAETDGETYTSEGTDENAILVDTGAEVTITNASVARTSDDSTGGDNSSFYGVGAAVLVTDGTLDIEDSTIDTDAAGGAGVFAYANGTANLTNVTIHTTQDTSGGIHAAGGGTLNATDCTVTTEGNSSAAIRSDRGGGTMNVSGGSYTSNGTGSPAVYCTADITVSDAELTATNSEAVCIEGLNSLTLENCSLTGAMHDDSQNDCTWNVILYQSMSGDSEEGNSTFSMTDGTLTAENGGMFYTTNTESTFYLKNVDITYSSDNPFFLQCTGNTNQRGWGSAGANGAQCSFTADEQDMEGDVIWDSISELDFYMNNGSTLKGAFIDDETWAGEGGEGYANLYIDSDSTWTVTADSTLTALYCEGTIVDTDGNTVTIKGTDGTVYVQGSGSVTVTVSSYSDSVD